MVTKQRFNVNVRLFRSVLAKILMVTKLITLTRFYTHCSVLAKILMVTKRIDFAKYMSSEFCSSKNPYGNKTSKIW